MINTLAKRTSEVGRNEKENARISRNAAQEGIVLLKNNGVLPIAQGARIALYGEGAANTIKGGIGSGEVNSRYVISIWKGLQKAGYEITTTKWLEDYQSLFRIKREEFKTGMRKRSRYINFGALKYILENPFSNPEGMPIVEEYLGKNSDCSIYVITRQSGENVDRMPVKGGFLLTDTEVENIRICTEKYPNTIIVINVGGYIDLSPLDELSIGGIIFFCQQGSEGGHALADIISGTVTPSAHLASSWPMKYQDVPFGENYSTLNGNTKYEEYREGIYVGYRYYDSFGVTPRYEFGYGLSYTSFEKDYVVKVMGKKVSVMVTTTNSGEYSGKEVVQLYISPPAGKLDKEYQRLVGFAKTDLLKPKECGQMEVEFSMENMSSYDEENNQFILEPGKYILRVGESSRQTHIIAIIELPEKVILSKHEAICPKQKSFEELHTERRADVTGEQMDSSIKVYKVDPTIFTSLIHDYPVVDYSSSTELDQLQNKLQAKDLAYLCAGSGLDVGLPKPHGFIIPGACGYSTSKFESKGIPAISFCDGPAGLRLFDISVEYGKTVRMARPVMASFDVLPLLVRKFMVHKPKKGKTLYQYTTAFPVGMSLAQSWNVEMAKTIGEGVRREMEEFGAEVWLAPGMNIHRNPLCGRNYEYYSEDPVLSGNMAAAICQSVQSKSGFQVTVKHFACNNQEIDRRTLSANIGQRALREIYLRNFEIAVKKGEPKALMTSYNKINGIYAAENYDLVTKVLRDEWGYQGLVMTDWTTEKNMLNSAKAMAAGINLMMPGIASDHKQILKAMQQGELTEKTMRINAFYVLRSITDSRLYKNKKEGRNYE